MVWFVRNDVVWLEDGERWMDPATVNVFDWGEKTVSINTVAGETLLEPVTPPFVLPPLSAFSFHSSAYCCTKADNIHTVSPPSVNWVLINFLLVSKSPKVKTMATHNRTIRIWKAPVNLNSCKIVRERVIHVISLMGIGGGAKNQFQ
jgi:hypothetical protein